MVDALKIEASQAEPYWATQVIDNPFADIPPPADPGVLWHWRAHHDNVPDSVAPHSSGRRQEEYPFAAPLGGVLRIGNFMRRHFKAALVTAELGDLGITLHKLRHTAASLAIASGAEVKVVQTMLGHKTATLTLDTYDHLWPDRLDEVSDRLDAQRTKALEKARKKADKAARKTRGLAEKLAALEAAGLAA